MRRQLCNNCRFRCRRICPTPATHSPRPCAIADGHPYGPVPRMRNGRSRIPFPMKYKTTTLASRFPVTAAVLALAALALPSAARASFLPPEVMDTAATYVAWFVICVVPIGAIVLFWMVHVLPEKIAHKRHHPQRDAIHTLCLLSLAVRRPAVADRLAVGLHEAGRLPARLRHRQARRLLPRAGREGAGGRAARARARASARGARRDGRQGNAHRRSSQVLRSDLAAAMPAARSASRGASAPTSTPAAPPPPEEGAGRA